SHQFPTGLVMPIQKRVELIKWAEQTNSYILEDDYDSELRFLGRPVPSLFSLDNSGRVINIGSFSTLIAPSLRISYIIVPEQIKVRYQKMIHGYRSTVSMAEQLTLAAYIEEGFFSRHLRRMRKKYSEKLKILISAMAPYQKNITLHHSDTGSFVLLEARNNTAAEAVRENSKRIGFEMEELWENFFVFQYAKIPEDKIQDFITRLQEESSSRH
ncbi:MAG: PLP-dependent aminotransferase family protein, partial [Ruminiclostridium sp.]|nr:PLP-dependent aminotransferase family protein [Ruminiclostridium sp.]